MTDHATTRSVLILALLLGVPAGAQDEATVTWRHPVSRVNGMPLSLNEIARTEIAYGLCTPDLKDIEPASAMSVSVPAPLRYKLALPLPSPGLWCVRARTILFSGLAGAWSNVATRVSPLPPYAGTNPPPFKLVM